MGPELLADQFGFNHSVVKINTSDLTHEDSLATGPGGGNCINWVLGHVVASRNSVLKILGCDPIWDAERAAPYSRGSQPITADNALPLEEILADYSSSQQTIAGALAKLTDKDLAAKSPVSFFKGDKETLGSVLAGFVFHEAYHIGQTGTLRHLAGKEGAIK